MPYLDSVVRKLLEVVCPPLFGTLYFDDQEVVDEFVLKYDLDTSVSSKVHTTC